MVSAAADLHTIWSVSGTAEGVHEPTGHVPVTALPYGISEEVSMALCITHCLSFGVYRFLLRIFFGVLGIVVITDSFHRKGSQTKVYTIISEA